MAGRPVLAQPSTRLGGGGATLQIGVRQAGTLAASQCSCQPSEVVRLATSSPASCPRRLAGFFLRQISDLGPMLTGLMTYHILPQPLSPDQLKVEGELPRGGW